MHKRHTYYIVYKPYNMLSQFSRENEGQLTLADLVYKFPKDVYPVGRLDADSEGLLLLTNDASLNARMLHPKHAHPRTYLAQVEGDITAAALEQLSTGVTIRIDGKTHQTLPAKASKRHEAPTLPERIPPVRYRKTVPDSWLELTLTEGKNRQVRRMCAAVGFPVLRLIRISMGQYQLGNLQPGEVLEINELIS